MTWIVIFKIALIGRSKIGVLNSQDSDPLIASILNRIEAAFITYMLVTFRSFFLSFDYTEWSFDLSFAFLLKFQA